jgi:hypothetical protein
MSKARRIPVQEQLAFELGYRQAIRDVHGHHSAECDELDKGLLLELMFDSLDKTYHLTYYGKTFAQQIADDLKRRPDLLD